MDVRLGREYADRVVEKAKEMVARYKELTERYVHLAGEAAEARDFARAAQFNDYARDTRDSMHYWLGHMNAFQGLATQLGFMEVVEDELEGEGSCP